MSQRKELSYEDRMKQALDVVARIPEGRFVLRHLLEASGYHKPMVSQSITGEINVTSTMYHVALRDIWHNLRRFMTFEVIALVEKDEPKPRSTAKKAKPENEPEEDDV